MKILGLEKKNIPLYLLMEQIIKSQIMMGEFLPGEQIPTERELAETYQVSTITSRQAILNLVNEGLLVRKQGKGTFVREGLTNIKNLMTLHLRGGLNDIVPEGITAQEVKCLDITRVKTSKKVAEVLDIGEGEKVVRIRRTRSDSGIPVSYIKNYLPVEIGEKIKKDDLLRHPMLHILRNHLGIPLRNGTQYIEAIVADYDVASALSVDISSPILYLETLIFAEKGKPVEFVQTFYRSDQFRYTLNLDLDETKRSGKKAAGLGTGKRID
jgi:GntR family transcriptional regulator